LKPVFAYIGYKADVWREQEGEREDKDEDKGERKVEGIAESDDSGGDYRVSTEGLTRQIGRFLR
jgi:hypothetical protein